MAIKWTDKVVKVENGVANQEAATKAGVVWKVVGDELDIGSVKYLETEGLTLADLQSDEVGMTIEEIVRYAATLRNTTVGNVYRATVRQGKSPVVMDRAAAQTLMATLLADPVRKLSVFQDSGGIRISNLPVKSPDRIASVIDLSY